jgi:hypothetical protein
MTDVIAEMIVLGRVTGLPKVVDALPPRYVKPARSQPGLLCPSAATGAQIFEGCVIKLNHAVPFRKNLAFS